MTLLVFRASTRMHLYQIRREIEAAHEEGLIDAQHTEACLTAHSTLSQVIALAADHGKDPEVNDSMEGRTLVLRRGEAA